MLYGVLVNDVVVITDAEHGLPIVEMDQPEPPEGYRVDPKWTTSPTSLVRYYDIVPIEGTAEEASLELSKLQFRSLPDDAAYLFRALADEWIAGETYYGPNDPSGILQSRVRYKGRFFKCLQTHTAQETWTPVDAPSLWAEILPGQAGNEPEDGSYAEWVQPDSTNGYATGDKVTHNGHIWESKVDSNIWEPGVSGTESLWTDLGEIPTDKEA